MVCAALLIGAFVGMYSETSLNLALPQLSKTFDISLALTQWLVVGYMLAIGLVMPFAGFLMRRYRMRPLIVAALTIFLVGSLISAVANSYTTVLLGRTIQGIGTGIILPCMFSVLRAIMALHKLGQAMGIAAFIIMFAAAIGPTLTGVLLALFGWRSIFVSFALLLAIALVLAIRFGQNSLPTEHCTLDVASLISSVLGFGGLVLAVGLLSLYEPTHPIVIVSALVGICALVLYVFHQLHMNEPVLNMKVFSNPSFTLGALCMMVNFGITLAVMYMVPQYFQNTLGLDASHAGLLLLPGGIINAAVSVASGRLYDKLGAVIPTTVGFAISFCAALIFVSAGNSASLTLVLTTQIPCMIGVPLAMSPAQTYALAALSPKLTPDGSTILNTLQQIFGAIATAAVSFLIVIGERSSSFAYGAHLGFIMVMFLCVVGFICAAYIAWQYKLQAQLEPELEQA